MRTTTLGASALLLATAAAQAAPVAPVIVTGYNQDYVVEAGSPANAAGVTTGTMDGGFLTPVGGTWYEQGHNAAAPATGVPAKNSLVASAAAPDHVYRFPSSYGPGNGAAGTTNNVFATGQGSGTPTITLTTPARYDTLSLIGSAGHGPISVTYTINYAGGGTQTGTLSVGDWFGGAGPAYVTNGRVTVNTGGFDNVNAGNPRLYTYDIALTNTTANVLSVNLSSASTTGTAAFFALSGNAVPEPAAFGLLGVAGLGLLKRRRA